MTEQELKQQIAEYFELDPDTIEMTPPNKYQDHWEARLDREGEREVYSVMDQPTAWEAHARAVENSLHLIFTPILMNFLENEVDEVVITALQHAGEHSNEALRSLVGDRFEELVKELERQGGGLGAYLSPYDGDCIELDNEWLMFCLHRNPTFILESMIGDE